MSDPFTEIPQKEHGTRQPNRRSHHTEDPPVDRKTLVKTLSSYTLFAGGTVIKMLAPVNSVNLRYVSNVRSAFPFFPSSRSGLPDKYALIFPPLVRCEPTDERSVSSIAK